MTKILIASKNPHKIEKLTQIIQPYFDELLTLQNTKIVDDQEELGNSFCEIAENKAIYFSKKFEGYAIATDGGMTIPKLESWNPLFTRRFISSLDKSDKSDFERMDELLEKTKDLKGLDRFMQWKEATAIANNGRLVFSKEANGSSGILQTEYDKNKYKAGIWLCSLWAHTQFENKNFFDLTTDEEKQSEISWDRLNDAVKNFMDSNPS